VNNNLRLLVACEFSGTVRDAFAALGWEAWSCDLIASEKPGNHHQRDVRDVINSEGPWDLLIAHPPCRYLSSSGMHWTTRGLRDPEETIKAIRFAELLWDAPIPRICLENPTGCLSTRSRLGKPRQRVQPYEFGHDASKCTWLWLKNLPALSLDPDAYIKPRRVCKCGEAYRSLMSCPKCGASVSFSKPRWANQTDSGQNKLAPSDRRAQERAITYPGIANAMARQWTDEILKVNVAYRSKVDPCRIIPL